MIVLATGGSGGHLAPAAAVTETLLSAEVKPEICVLTPSASKARAWFKSGAIRFIETPSYSFQGLRSLMSPIFYVRQLQTWRDTLRIVRELNPDLVIGFGGYTSFWATAAAVRLKKKTLIQEQNASLGLANRLLFPWVTQAAFSMDSPALPLETPKSVMTGHPMILSSRKDIKAGLLKSWNLCPSKKTIAIVGGSQGASHLNEVLKDFLINHAHYVEHQWQFLHLTGKRDFQEFSHLETKTKGYHAIDFTNRMDQVYSAADLVIVRAGASTLHELCAYSKPAILIPYPHSRSHQIDNARMLSDRGGAWLVLDSEWNAAKLYEFLKKIDNHPEMLEKTGKRCGELLNVGGAKIVAGIVTRMLEEEDYAAV
jgi:UDP-N-acetylglucosamine--N-acetylmuramyl-(pentapeptide) pyrophosphoryl-undecaprenol N-acetylglucosamine transferase